MDAHHQDKSVIILPRPHIIGMTTTTVNGPANLQYQLRQKPCGWMAGWPIPTSME